MTQFLHFPCLVLILVLALISCAGIEQQAITHEAETYPDTAPKFSAWKSLDSSRRPVAANKAVRELLSQADTLISDNSMQQASDKLERLLRIEPAYAQAWSRLAWIALQSNAPERGRQMAQRSNSYAYDNKNLKVLNWAFIREAGELMKDEATVRNAEAMINLLGGNE